MNYILLLCFCFKNLDLFDRQTTHLDFSLSPLFVIFTSCGLKLWVKFLHPQTMHCPKFFSSFYWFYFWLCAFLVLYYQFFFYFLKIISNLVSCWVFYFFSFLILYFCFLILLFEVLVFLVFLLALLFRLLFLFLIFLYLIEQCNPVFY